MVVYFECSGHWSPPCDVRAGDELDYDPESGALCPECGRRVNVLIETVALREVPA